MDLKKSWLFSRPIAHRGLHGEGAPENSIIAFERAIKHGFPIELDVRPIDDGTLVVFHDDSLKRMTDCDGYVSTLSLNSLSEIKLNGSDEKIPTFERVLELVNGKTPILIEVKNEGTVGALERNLWDMLSSYKGEFALQSFNPYSMEFFKKRAPHVARGQLAKWFTKDELPFFKRYFLSRLKLNGVSSPDFISYCGDDLPNKHVNRAKLPTLAWTAKNQEQFDEFKSKSSNVIFEGFIPKTE